MKRVVVGLSGGVDSSVAALLLQQQGYEVIGLFMKNWHDTEVTISDECPWIDDSNDALMVAQHLGIPFQTIDLSDAYKERIVDYMFSEYEKGRTPNPDVLCNREIKFDVFLEAALKLGADYVATGHYCRRMTDEKGVHHLLAGKDNNKDQSYFLCQLNQYQLSKALFPIGDLQKSEVRKIAEEHNLITADKKDSQGLCFVGKIKLPDFLQQQLKPKRGDIVEIEANHPIYQSERTTIEQKAMPYNYDIDMGIVVGQHTGAHYFTIGQRKGLDVGGKPEPLFVIGTDTVNNVVYVGQGQNHPGLYRTALKVESQEMHQLHPIEDAQIVQARIRYRQPLQNAKMVKKEGSWYLDFEKPQRGITAGQFAAWYNEDDLLGSGVIHG